MNSIHIAVILMKTQKAEIKMEAHSEKKGAVSGKLIAAVRIRGAFMMGRGTKDTLKMLRLNRKNHCVLLRGTNSERGMLQRAKDYITFGEINEDTLKALVAKRGRAEGNRKLAPETAEAAAREISTEGKSKLLKPVFRLTPPSGGFREIKQHFPKGDIGYRGEKINELLERMM